MINKTNVVNAYNAQEGVAKLRDRKGDFTERFLDMEFQNDITEEMLIECIKNGYVKSREALFDSAYIKASYSEILQGGEVKEDVKELKEEVEEEAPKYDSGEPFMSFEQMISNVIGQQAGPIAKKVAEDVLGTFLEEHKRDFEKITRNIEWTCEERNGSTKGITHEKFETICEFISGNEPVLLVGPAGTGKNFTAKQVAERFNLEFYFTGAVTQEYKLMGFIDANGRYHDTQFFRAFTGLKVGDDGSLVPIENGGGLFFFDEVDVSDPEVLKGFNSGLENGYMDFPIGRFDAHPNYRVIAAANTWGTGSSFEYVGHQLDASTIDRFMPEWFDYDPRVEESLTDDVDLLNFIRTFRKACTDYGIKCVTSYRAIRRCEKFKGKVGYPETLKASLLKNLEQDDLGMMVDRFRDKADVWSKTFMDIATGRC